MPWGDTGPSAGQDDSAGTGAIPDVPQQPVPQQPVAQQPVPQPPAGMRGTPGPLLRVVKDQRLAFLVVGGTNTLIGALFFAGWLLTGVPYLVALLLAHVCAVLCAFALYRHLVFRVRGHLFGDLWRFELVNLTQLAINAALLPVGVEVLHLRPLVAQILITGLTVVISFFGHRDFSFRRSPRVTAGLP